MPDLSPNPYRQILARRFPEPFVALLAFLLGVWLWSNYFGKKEGYEKGTDRLTVVKLDRDSRLAEAMADDPPWLRWLAGAEDLPRVQHRAKMALEELAKEHSLSGEGIQAYGTLFSEEEGGNLLGNLRQMGGIAGGDDLPPSREALATKLQMGEGSWIDREIAKAYLDLHGSDIALTKGLATYGEGTAVVRKRAIVSGYVVWSVILIGTFFIPVSVLRLFKIRNNWDTGYGRAWSVSLGLVVFLAATLSWIGFLLAMRAGFMAVPDIPQGLGLALGAGMGLLPALIAIGLLFRRPSHAVRAFGLNRAPSWELALGLFAMLEWVNQGFAPLLEHLSSPNPTGGLNMGEKGGWGLAFAFVSACLVAPISEEILYRGVLFRSLANRFGVAVGALSSAGVFALVHFYNLYGLASVALFGFICALAYSATRSLTTAVLLHFLYNVVVKLPEWFVYHAPLPGN